MTSKTALRSLFLASVAAAALCASAAPAATPPAIATVDYVEGTASVTRAGKNLGPADIGDSLYSGDLVETKADGLLIFRLSPSSGWSGTVNVKPKSAIYVGSGLGKQGEAKTTIDLVAGAIASKVTKTAGSPLMQVTTSGTVLGVRGTSYEVAAPLTGAVLVVCAEGQVWVTDGKAQNPVDAGKAIEKRPGESFKYLPVALSSIGEFRDRWVADEIAAFNSAPLKALAQYEKLYSERLATFTRAFDALQKSAVLKKWIEEDKAGVQPRALDPAVMREKKEIVGTLQDIRQNLFVFERIYYRLEEVAGLVAGTPAARSELRKGVVAEAFLKKFAAERDGLAARVALFRYADSLYALRDAGSPQGGDSFFGSDANFFGSGGF